MGNSENINQLNLWVMSFDELVQGSGGKALSARHQTFSGIGTDTRSDLSGKIFVALKGEQFDAHDFLTKALESGAAALLVHRLPADEQERAKILEHVTVVQVEDTLIALQDLARFWRRKMKARIFGLTGTNGKTTTKEFAAAVLGTKLRVQYSAGSFNNHWGVPISLLSIDSSHEAAVIEMGMNHLGELETLSKIVEPDVVLCTMVGQGHLEGVGSVEGVAKAKSEIYEFAPSHAVKIFNLENPYTRKMYSDWGQRLPPAQRFTFAGFSWEKTASHLSSSQVVIPASDVAMDVVAAGLDWISVKGRIREVHGEARVPVFGRQNITNIMAAACFGLVAGLSPQEIWAALPMCRTAWGRNQWVALHSGAQVLFDAYNANPESMRAAVENFAQLQTDKQGRKMAVLGEMRELGARTPDLHRELGRQVARAGFDAVAFIGPSKASFQEGLEAGGFSKKLFITDTYEDSLASHVLPVLDQSDIVLFKGSRGMRLEKVLEALKPIDFHSKK